MSLPAHDRRALIGQSITFEGWASVVELAKRYEVSQVCIRRDLQELEAEGMLKRVRGGAVPSGLNSLTDIYGQRAAKKVEAKRRIAREAAKLIEPNDRIILDSGSTIAELARLIPTVVPVGHHLRVITGSCPVVDALTPYPQIQLLVLGGMYLHQYRTLVGPQTLQGLGGLHVDKMFMGSDGVTVETGTTTANVLEAEVTQAMASSAATLIVVADSSKIGLTGFTTVMPMRDVDILITDQDAPAEFVAHARAMGVEVHLV
jgi:DeoR/GlpR family transcriptional regulator of sugar metabolism